MKTLAYRTGHRMIRIAIWMTGSQVILAVLATSALAAEVQVGGKLSHSLFYATDQGAVVQNETRYELTLDVHPSPDGRLYFSWKGAIPSSGDRAFSGSEQAGTSPLSLTPTLDEAYLDAYFPAVDLRVGRQIINWGTADGINPTNIINPRSLSVDALVEQEVAGTPVPAVQLAGDLGATLGLTAVGVLDFVPAPFPKEAVHQLAQDIATRGGSALESEWLNIDGVGSGNQYEWALRAEGMLAGYNVYASYFNGYTDLPALWMQLTNVSSPAFAVHGRYRRQQQFGLATAGTVRDMGVWCEATYTLPEKLDPLDAGSPTIIALSSNSGTWQAVAGADHTFTGNVYASGQFVYNQAGSLLLPYSPPGEKAGLYGVGLLRYTPNARSTWDAVAVVNLRDRGTVVAPGLTYELKPGIKLVVRYVDVVGGDDSEFGRLRPQFRGIASRLEALF
ncbi:MAG: hypothetical protein IMX01_09790 [Limnochordaceae bacterium]|nr:hypothetical protein [Limnochordaceae bacterium]